MGKQLSTNELGSSRRSALGELTHSNSTHIGLWLDKFITNSGKGDPEAKHGLIEDITSKKIRIGPAEDYKKYFDLFKAALTELPTPVLTAEGSTEFDGVNHRLAVGLGASAVLENSITLHRTYGVPYIPGSALKGLASSYAAAFLEDETWARSFKNGKTERGKLQELIFGTTEESGLITFFDALPVPGSWSLDADVATVHHPHYYQGKGGEPPADWDSPTPIPFITAKGRFLFALGLAPVDSESEETGLRLLHIAFELLKRALREVGVGAKTAIGYGRIGLEEAKLAEPPEPERSEDFRRIQNKLAIATFQNLPQTMKEVARLWAGLPPEEQCAVIELIKQNNELMGWITGPKAHPDMERKAVRKRKNEALLALMSELMGWDR